MRDFRMVGIVCFMWVVVLFTFLLTGDSGFSREIRTESGEEMLFIPGGSFRMHISDDTFIEVTVDSFYMAKYPVTQRSFQRIMGTNPSRWQDESRPVDRVTWAGAVEYCNRLSRLEGLQPVYNEETWEMNPEADGYRLPTEAEWEYAARGGTDTRYFWGDDSSRLRFFAWIEENSASRTRPVGQKMPNPFGLYDIYGNVWEWCYDYYKEDYSPEDKETNPTGPESGEYRVVRGGSWSSAPEEASSVFRGKAKPGYEDICTAAYDIYGFRIIRNAGDDQP